MNLPLTKKDIAAKNAILQNNIKFFLTEWYTFRLYIIFNENQIRRTFYGNEHSVTLNQLKAGYKTSFVMDKKKGFDDLINLVEKKWKGKYKTAVIFMRDEHGKPFDIEVRRYYKGELQEGAIDVTDFLTEQQNIELFYHGILGNSVTFKTVPVPDLDSKFLPGITKLKNYYDNV